MAKYSMECPECGNWVEGKVKATLARKLTRGAVRKGASSAIGATIGTVILPGVGTVVGSGIGIAIGALMEDHIQEASDLVEDAVFDNADIQFTCPNCSHFWEKTEEEIRAMMIANEIESESDIEEIDDEEDEEEMTYDDLRRVSCIEHYSRFLENLYDKEGKNVQVVIDRIKADIGLEMEKFKVKKQNDVLGNTFAFLIRETDEDFNWYNLITHLPHGKNEDAFELDMYYCGVFDNIGSVLIGVIKSGCVAVGDKIAIYTKDGKQHEAEVTMVELFMKKLPSAECGDSLGLGVDIDLSDLLDDIVAVKAISTTEANTELTSEEQEYVDALKEYLSDGEISERERKMLDRVRKALGITEDRAAQLESGLNQPTLSDDEKEYLEAYREYIVDGAIDDKSRKRLEIFRKGLGLSEERAKEMEQMA